MAKRPSKRYELVPSLGRSSSTEGYLPTLPAVPVKIGESPEVERYALIDTGAHVSLISKSIFEELDLPVQTYWNLAGPTIAGALHAPVITANLTICDTLFKPWIVLSAVPFIVLESWGSAGEPSIMLGVENCLSHLTLEIDYPHSALTISAPQSLVKPTPAFKASHRLADAQRLFDLKAYGDAVAFAAFAVEQTLRAANSTEASIKSSMRQLLRDAGYTGEDAEEFGKLRNQAVHAGGVTRRQAERALAFAETVLRGTF